MDTNLIRENSRRLAAELGYEFNEHLPVLEEIRVARTADEVVDRILCLQVTIACAYGFSRSRAVAWLDQERLADRLAASEQSYLHHEKSPESPLFKTRIESLWALTWFAGYHANLDFGAYCSDSFIALFPDIKQSESADTFRAKARLRSTDELEQALDLAYCLHWAVRDGNLKGRRVVGKNQIKEYVIIERRRALEWLAGDDAWDDVPMDT